MNVFSLLPLIAVFTNISMCFYIYYNGLENKLNKLFILFELSLVIWCLGDFLTFISTSTDIALFWNHFTLIGACFTVAFLLHFFMIFTKNQQASNKTYLIFLYLPVLFFASLDFTTNIISKSAISIWWGYYIVRGELYIPYTLYLVLYVIIGFFLCFRYYPKSISKKEKTQTKLLISAVSVPLIGGITTQIIPVVIGIKMIPLTSILTTITAIIIAYAIVRHKLMITGSFSIYRKLVASFLIIIVLILNVGFFSAVNNRELLQRNIGDESLLLVSRTMDEIDSLIYNRVESFQLQIDDHNHVFQKGIIESNQEFETFGSDQDIYDYIYEKNMEWISTPENETNSFMENILNNNISKRLMGNMKFYEKKYNYSLFGELFVTNKYGANVGQTIRTTDYYQADEEWWQNSKQDGLYIGNVNFDDSSNIYSIDISIRIDDENEDFIGIFKAIWDIKEINHVLDSSRLAQENNEFESMNCFLLDSNGRLIYSTEEFVFLENKSNILNFLIDHSGKEDSYLIISDSEFDEGDRLIAHSHSENIMNFNGLEWTLIMEYDANDIFGSIYDLWNLIIFSSILVAIISLLFGYFISRSISKPIIKLRNIAKEIGTGNLDVNIDIHSNDEVGELATTFGTMKNDLKKSRGELQDYSQNLEKKVNERTIELEKSRDTLKNNIEKLEKNKLAMSHITRDLNSKNKELHNTHKMLETINEGLEQKVDKRTEEIKRLLKQKDEFIGQLGHDLKNPLGPLINLLPLLEKKETDPKSKQMLEVLNRNANHMKNLVVNTIELGRLNSPNVKLNIEDTNLLNEVNKVIERNSLLFEGNSIEIENNTDENIFIKADKLRLTELFDNLFTNSVKFSPDGGIITIDTKLDKDFITVSIRDTGIGITEEQLDYIFDEFYKADLSRHDFDSSGLGLPISKRIVEKHGGKIWAESEGKGKGTTVFFTLPVNPKKVDIEKKLGGS